MDSSSVHLFELTEDSLRVFRFEELDEVKLSLKSWVTKQIQNCFQTGSYACVQRWRKCNEKMMTMLNSSFVYRIFQITVCVTLSVSVCLPPLSLSLNCRRRLHFMVEAFRSVSTGFPTEYGKMLAWLSSELPFSERVQATVVYFPLFCYSRKIYSIQPLYRHSASDLPAYDL